LKTVHDILNPGGDTARVRAEVIAAWLPARPSDVLPELLEPSLSDGRTDFDLKKVVPARNDWGAFWRPTQTLLLANRST
jgi:hypothetical protein